MKNIFSISKAVRHRTIGLVAALVLMVTSCQDLSEINKSPNQLGANEINIKYVLTSVLSGSARDYLYEYAYPGGWTVSEAMQYLQRDYIDFQGPNTFVWGPKDFSSPFLRIKNSQYIVENATLEKSENNQKFYTGVGQIMRSFWYGYLTSLYGDIPYSEAMKAEEGNFTPVYDNQKDIFKGILEDLKSANDLLAQVSSVEGAASSDILFGGDIMKWRKFANSLRLRYLLRLSEKISDMSGVDVKGEFNAIVSNSSANPIFTSNGDNAAISYIGTAAANSWYGGPLAYTNRSEFHRRKPCATFVDAMVEGRDPRLTTFIRPVDAQLRISNATPEYSKLPDGQIIRNIPTSTPGTDQLNTRRYVGLPAALQDPNLYNLATGVDFNAIKALTPTIYTDLAANPGVSYLADMYAQNVNPLVKAVFMSYAELCFILSEGRLKDWITAGDAVDYYKAGVVASMRQYNIADGSVKVYDPNTDALVAWNESAFLNNLSGEFTGADDNGKLTKLMTQKWLACFMTPEFWFDWRRTGVPDLGANVILGSNGKKIPVRIIYPDGEKNLNSENLADAITRLQPGENTQWSKMWLLQGTNKPW
ncbi:MAG: SusD/RagB family nutrient-binding outer membrane lipoprotein [Chitinophagaceae bacterium]|nr:SusD/RagB family nutrient-binding outer membrane lipoprotein [Chitinophagaceae bacterium]